MTLEQKKVKLFSPYVSLRSKLYALQVLCSDYIAEGKWVKHFEMEFAKKFGFEYFLTTNSGTSALEVIYDAIGIKEGDEVITTSLTCVATNVGLARRKAKIVFADIDETLNLDPISVASKITKKTKAIVFVHFGGRNDNLDDILLIGKKHKIPVIEDAAQAIGSDNWGKADFTAVSFDAIKTLTSGDGGGVICNNADDYQKIYQLRWYGLDRAKFQKNNESELTMAGYKANMNNISAAIALGNLRSIDKVIAHKRLLQDTYIENDIEAGIWAGEVVSPNRDKIMFELKKAGIESGIHHYRNDVYKLFGDKRQNLPYMNKIENQYLLLPLHYNVTIKDVDKISKIVNKYK